jgi:Fur family ferric uptake transcriptional regulator
MPHQHRHEDGCCGQGAPDRVDVALRRMKDKSLRVTGPRQAMLRVLSEAQQPLSAEEIHTRAGDGTLDLVTVYRSLGALEEAAIVQRHPLERGRSLYALPAAGHHHHHVICRRCGRIDRLPGCDTTAVEAAARNQGYAELTHVLEVYGICPACTTPSHD